AAAVISVEGLAVERAFHAGYLVELDDRVVAVEGPDAGGVVVAADARAADDVAFNERAVAAPDLDAVAADVLQQVASNDDVSAAHSPAATLANAVAVRADDVAVLDQQIIEARLIAAP